MSATVKPFLQGLESSSTVEIKEKSPAHSAQTFFRTLNVERFGMVGSMGTSWADLKHPERMASKLARVDMALSGIDGISELLHAAERAVCDGSDSIGENLRDRLFYALRSLATSARDDLEAGRALADGER